MVQAVIVFAATVALLVTLRPLAPAIGLVDRPGGRKRHHGEVAVIGGLAMFGGYSVGALLLPASMHALLPSLPSLAMLVAVGAVDDRLSLGASMRLFVQLTAAIIMVYSGDATIERVITWNDGSFISLGAWAPAFTVLAVVTAINAYNLVDGLDGLAAGLGFIALTSFLLLSVMTEAGLEPALALACGAVTAFLAFNAPIGINQRVRCFMGDAGSTMMGLLVAWFGIRIGQNVDGRLNPTIVLWVTAVPIMELIVSFGRRLAQGRSPFSADADHFHHVLLRAGFSVPATCAILLSISLTFSLCGLLLEYLGVDGGNSLMLLLTMGSIACLGLRNITSLKLWLSRPRRIRRMRLDKHLLHADLPIAKEQSGLER
jgi:UDP-GlcNAc:undecaprenyl-phosphate GlcNAc-1-phosphate transferase